MDKQDIYSTSYQAHILRNTLHDPDPRPPPQEGPIRRIVRGNRQLKHAQVARIKLHQRLTHLHPPGQRHGELVPLQ